jgi:hypothetical protein
MPMRIHLHVTDITSPDKDPAVAENEKVLERSIDQAKMKAAINEVRKLARRRGNSAHDTLPGR